MQTQKSLTSGVLAACIKRFGNLRAVSLHTFPLVLGVFPSSGMKPWRRRRAMWVQSCSAHCLAAFLLRPLEVRDAWMQGNADQAGIAEPFRGCKKAPMWSLFELRILGASDILGQMDRGCLRKGIQVLEFSNDHPRVLAHRGSFSTVQQTDSRRHFRIFPRHCQICCAASSRRAYRALPCLIAYIALCLDALQVMTAVRSMISEGVSLNSSYS